MNTQKHIRSLGPLCLGFSLVLLFGACSPAPEQAETVFEVEEAAVVETTVADLLADPLNYENRRVHIEGHISHVCRHSGDKMRVLQDDSDLSIQVRLGAFTGQFDTESEGLRVAVTGLFKTEVANIDELEDHECETTLQAIEAMKAKGLDVKLDSYIQLENYEIVQID